MNFTSSMSSNALRINLQGEFTFADNQQFQKMVGEIEGSRSKAVVLDFAGLEFIDSAALSMLLVLRETCAKRKTQLSIQNGSGRVKDVLDEMRFSKFIKTSH